MTSCLGVGIKHSNNQNNFYMAVKSKATQLSVKLDDLVLDINNPRFAELYSGSLNEDDLIEYLLYTEAAEEVAKAIVKAGEFHPDRPLWVIKDGKKFLVKDGNRRCSAVKALQLPGKYKLGLAKTTIKELPVLLYKSLTDVNDRILEEHAGNLFRRWERIAKALEVLKLADTGKWEEARELDSKPGELIKLASFYKEAVVFGGDDLRQLLRRGRGKTGGKTIIFERLFRDSKLCGYQFKNSPSFRIDVQDETKFSTYVLALIKYLKANPDTNTQSIDSNPNFLKLLAPYGFDPNAKTSTDADDTSGNTSDSVSSTGAGETEPGQGEGTVDLGVSGFGSGTLGSSGTTSRIGTVDSGGAPSDSGTAIAGSGGTGSSSGTAGSIGIGRGSVKKIPTIKRKALPPGLKSRIKEYFDIDPITQPNSKIAMARITFECILKYVVETTKFNGRTMMNKSGHFGLVYRKPPFADFTLMKTKFTELIVNTGDRTAFSAFDLDNLHTIVHNYKVNGISANAEQISYNLIGLIEFMLQSESDLLSSLNLTKL